MFGNRRLWEGVQVAVIAAMFIVAAARWGSVPDRIPIHWNAAGEVDGYGGRFSGLLLIPILTLGLYGLLALLPRIDPLRRNYQYFAGTYLAVRVMLTAYMGFIYLVTNLAIGNEEAVPVAELIIGSIGVLFIALGVAMPRFRTNWFAGIRTPWTLTSRRSWEKTHRAGRVVFIAAGIGTLVGASIGATWALVAMLVLILPGTLFLIVYSYLVWRDDPERAETAASS